MAERENRVNAQTERDEENSGWEKKQIPRCAGNDT